MLSALTLAVALLAPPEVEAARVELDQVAGRIEELKARHRAGENVARELLPLLVRAQELAGFLDRERRRPERPSPAPPPSVEELRERADAYRDEADRLVLAVARLDERLARARAASQDRGPFRPAASGRPISPAELRAMEIERSQLQTRLEIMILQAERLEAEALEAERDGGR